MQKREKRDSHTTRSLFSLPFQAKLVLEDQQILNVLLSRDRFDELELKLHQKVYVKPKEVKSFSLQPV